MKRQQHPTKHRGFTLVELLIVIVIIGILASITSVAYNGITEQARNTATVSLARQYYTILKIANVQGSVTFPAGTIGRFCLSDETPVVDGTHECGEVNGTKPATYSQTLIDQLKQVSSTLPAASPDTMYSPTIYYGPTVEFADTWLDQNGNPVTSILHYWLEGNAKNCVMPTIIFDYSQSPVPEGQPGATAVIRPSGQDYSYTDSKATYCYVKID